MSLTPWLGTQMVIIKLKLSLFLSRSVRVLELIITPGSQQNSCWMKSNILPPLFNQYHPLIGRIDSSIMIRTGLFNNPEPHSPQTIGWTKQLKLFYQLLSQYVEEGMGFHSCAQQLVFFRQQLVTELTFFSAGSCSLTWCFKLSITKMTKYVT